VQVRLNDVSRQKAVWKPKNRRKKLGGKVLAHMFVRSSFAACQEGVYPWPLLAFEKPLQLLNVVLLSTIGNSNLRKSRTNQSWPVHISPYTAVIIIMMNHLIKSGYEAG
jgi:hypothetical protein